MRFSLFGMLGLIAGSGHHCEFGSPWGLASTPIGTAIALPPSAAQQTLDF